MAENWQPKDYALCVNDRWDEPGKPIPAGFPRKGQCFKVVGVMHRGEYLMLAGFPRHAFASDHFIKVTPSPELIAQERLERMPA